MESQETDLQVSTRHVVPSLPSPCGRLFFRWSETRPVCARCPGGCPPRAAAAPPSAAALCLLLGYASRSFIMIRVRVPGFASGTKCWSRKHNGVVALQIVNAGQARKGAGLQCCIGNLSRVAWFLRTTRLWVAACDVVPEAHWWQSTDFLPNGFRVLISWSGPLYACLFVVTSGRANPGLRLAGCFFMPATLVLDVRDFFCLSIVLSGNPGLRLVGISFHLS